VSVATCGRHAARPECHSWRSSRCNEGRAVSRAGRTTQVAFRGPVPALGTPDPAEHRVDSTPRCGHVRRLAAHRRDLRRTDSVVSWKIRRRRQRYERGPRRANNARSVECLTPRRADSRWLRVTRPITPERRRSTWVALREQETKKPLASQELALWVQGASQVGATGFEPATSCSRSNHRTPGGPASSDVERAGSFGM